MRDVEAGPEQDTWDEWEPDTPSPSHPATHEPEEAEEDPFADLGMAPVVTKTVRHNVVSRVAYPHFPTCLHQAACPTPPSLHHAGIRVEGEEQAHLVALCYECRGGDTARWGRRGVG